jgi:hypothetical protein
MALVSQVMSQEPYAGAKRVFWIVDNGFSHRGKKAADRLTTAFPNAVMVHTRVASEPKGVRPEAGEPQRRRKGEDRRTPGASLPGGRDDGGPRRDARRSGPGVRVRGHHGVREPLRKPWRRSGADAAG